MSVERLNDNIIMQAYNTLYFNEINNKNAFICYTLFTTDINIYISINLLLLNIK